VFTYHTQYDNIEISYAIPMLYTAYYTAALPWASYHHANETDQGKTYMNMMDVTGSIGS
jgi:hypothetical protein